MHQSGGTGAPPTHLCVPYANRVHALVPAPAHHKPGRLIALDFVAGQTNLTTPRDALALSHKRSHRRPLPRKQVPTIVRGTGAQDDPILAGLGANKGVLLLLLFPQPEAL